MRAFVVICFTFLSFGNAVAEEQFVPIEINPSLILTFQDYEGVRREAWSRHEKRKQAEWKNYERSEKGLLEQLEKSRKEKVLELRTSNFDIYIEWLDAKELNDYPRIRTLEDRSPAFKQYSTEVVADYVTYMDNKIDAFERYEKGVAESFRVYQEEDRMAYNAYYENNKKK